MAMNDRCPSCGAMVMPSENYCPQCGAPLNAVGAGSVRGVAPGTGSDWRPGTTPRTIEELRAFCAYNEMPLEKMRFFIGEDYRQPKAFGIYRDGDQVVVYKNKADGSRAVRYHGPDEAHGVDELYRKLLDECHARDIWPDGKPAGYDERRKRQKRARIIVVVAMVVVFIAVAVVVFWADSRLHTHDGYYRFQDDGLYYLYGNDWYYYSDPYYDWVAVQEPYEDYGDYYVGRTYDSDWGYSDFERSDAWESIHEESHTHSSDYDSWDSGGTDWSSDW